GPKTLHPRSKYEGTFGLPPQDVEQSIDFTERRREIRIPVADDRPPSGPGDMEHAATNRFGLAAVGRQSVHEDSVRALRTQLLQHRHGAVAAPIVNEAHARGGMIGDETHEVGSTQPVLLVEARNDYADFLHMAKLERPGMRMPMRASASEMR